MQHHDPGFLPFLGACLAGAFVSAIRYKDGTLVERVSSGLVGFLVAFYLGPVFADWFNLGPQYLASCGFVVGLIGKEIATIIIDFSRDYGPAFMRNTFKGD